MNTLSNTQGRTAILAVVLVLIATLGAAGDWPPSAVPLNKYQASWEKNPFDLKTASAGKNGGFASDLTLAGISKIGDSTTVLALNGKTGQYLRLNIGRENADGIEVIKIKENGNPREAEVVLRKGNSEAVLKFGDRSKTTPARNRAQTSGTNADSKSQGNGSRSAKVPQSGSKRAAPASPSGGQSSNGFRLPPSEEAEVKNAKPLESAEAGSEASVKPYAEPLKYGTGKAAETRRRAMNSVPQAAAANAQ